MAENVSTKSNGEGLTLTVLGCGTMGIAILSGILASLKERAAGVSPSSSVPEPERLPTRVLACVRSDESRKRIENEMSKHLDQLSVVQKNNVKCVEEADVVLLACKPFYVQSVLQEKGMREALEGKLVVSILAGVNTSQLADTLYHGRDMSQEDGKQCIFVRAMPNTNAVIRESMTIIEQTPSLNESHSKLLTWMFSQCGQVTYLPPANMDAATALCGSGPAFVALMIESLMHGGLSCGIPRLELQKMVSQTMVGMAIRARDGDKHVAVMKDEVCTPGGCTIYGLDVMEKAGLKGTIIECVREATIRASELGSVGAAPRRT